MRTIIIVQPCNCSSGFNERAFGVTGFRLFESFAPIFIVNIFYRLFQMVVLLVFLG